ncbi:MAG TPA: hypothetical protein VD867_04810 [Burkholderiales bacterium]|nr:hypothetical protein [Burkholderiales bacterium]
MTQVVIVLPGIMGSELWDGKERVWPGTFDELNENHDMRQLMKPDLVVGDILRRVLTFKRLYVDLMEALEACGFHEKGKPPTLYTCAYDWRKDGALAAGVLAVLIERTAAEHGGDVEIILIGHSMGGLVSRYYLECGRFDGRPGFDRVRRLITLATPHYGTPVALLGATGNHRATFLSAPQVQQLSNDSQFPALYQVMPPRSQPFVWDDDPGARFKPVDIYDAPIAQALGLSQQNLQAAVSFRTGLDLARRPPRVAYFFFCGTRQDTVCEVRVRQSSGSVSVSLYDVDEDAGDGVIPTWNASHPDVQTAAVGAKAHYEVFRGRDLLELLAALLGHPGAVRFEPRAAELSGFPLAEIALRDPVITAGSWTNAVISFDDPVPDIKGKLVVRQVVDEHAKAMKPVVASRLTVAYKGVPMDRITVRIQAPDRPGLYKVSFVPHGTKATLAQDDWVVQFPVPSRAS